MKTLVPEFSQPYRATRATCSSYQGPAGIGGRRLGTCVSRAFRLCILSFTKRLTYAKLETLTLLGLIIFLLTDRSFWIGKYMVFS